VRYSSDAVKVDENEDSGKGMRETIVIKVDVRKPPLDKIRVAAKVIREGGTVAFPTETVYGLGADALNPEAVRKIFLAKKRPPDNPVIIHVADKEEVYRLARKVPKEAVKLMEKFWPGPLTLILRAADLVPRITTAGLDTVAIRMPSHEVALALIRESETPIAAPSANIAGKPSPITADHVMEDLYGRIDLILDAGPSNVGVESTVLDMTVDPPQILRAGGTTYEELKETLGRVELHPAIVSGEVEVSHPPSPGMKYRHYLLDVEVVVVEGEPDAIERKVQELADLYRREGKKVGIMATDESVSTYTADVVKSLGRREDLETIAKNLFTLLRELEKEKVDIIIAEGVAPKGLGLAVINRLRKAAGFNVIKV